MAKSLFFTLFLLLLTPGAFAGTEYDKELMYRLRFSSVGDIRLLLSHGANPNSQNDQGVPALSAVFERTDDAILPMLKLLVKHGADVNSGGTALRPPLIEAAAAGDLASVRYLVESGKARLDVRDGQNETPLSIANKNGRAEVAQYLAAAIAAQKPVKPNTPAFRARQGKALAFHACARQYWSYYYASGQDSVPAATQRATLQQHEAALKEAMEDLYRIFQIPVEKLTSEQQASGKEIVSVLDSLISNRNRRSMGVGKLSDLNRRCGKIAERSVLAQPARSVVP